MGGGPPSPKLFLSEIKSLLFTNWSPLKSARLSYPTCPGDLPNGFFRVIKSLELTKLSLLQSPASCKPISVLVMEAPASVRVPLAARKPGLYSGGEEPTCALFTLQLYPPFASPLTDTVKKPLASVVCTE